MPYLYDYDDFEDNAQSTRKRTTKPRVKGSHHDHFDDADLPYRFEDPGLEQLHGLGYIDSLIGELKSGKEANVYLINYRGEFLAAKVYKDLAVRSFKNDSIYRQGRFIGDARAEKAISQRSRFGKQVQQSLWASTEYNYLWTLYQEGLAVPEPKIGPDSSAISEAGPVVLMSFIGEGNIPAPRLSDIKLERQEAQEAFQQSLDIMLRLLNMDLVHGDFSTYNLLWHQGQVIVIDFPQLARRDENPAFNALVSQDVTSLCQSFRKHGLSHNPAEILSEIQRQAR